MQWHEIRATHPGQWLVVEALAAHSAAGRRIVDDMVVVEVCQDGATAHRRYRELRREDPARELYFLHTGKVDLDIPERPWIGLRNLAIECSS